MQKGFRLMTSQGGIRSAKFNCSVYVDYKVSIRKAAIHEPQRLIQGGGGGGGVTEVITLPPMV